ncbi:hypothetical protein BLW93_03050 [Desulfurobacterium indicum]|uniref:Uncharacterized protein n=1 Tax=Desulfurobacterium indicum TaxID=1914305 RepID=A0A1R1MMC5_9BACT|nr:hypothetical protein BLW93_03050 [Desulfurobacterium indicum]
MRKNPRQEKIKERTKRAATIKMENSETLEETAEKSQHLTASESFSFFLKRSTQNLKKLKAAPAKKKRTFAIMQFFETFFHFLLTNFPKSHIL